MRKGSFDIVLIFMIIAFAYLLYVSGDLIGRIENKKVEKTKENLEKIATLIKNGKRPFLVCRYGDNGFAYIDTAKAKVKVAVGGDAVYIVVDDKAYPTYKCDIIKDDIIAKE